MAVPDSVTVVWELVTASSPTGISPNPTEPSTPWWVPGELHLAALQEAAESTRGIPGEPLLRHSAKSFASILTPSSRQLRELGNISLIL